MSCQGLYPFVHLHRSTLVTWVEVDFSFGDEWMDASECRRMLQCCRIVVSNSSISSAASNACDGGHISAAACSARESLKRGNETRATERPEAGLDSCPTRGRKPVWDSPRTARVHDKICPESYVPWFSAYVRLSVDGTIVERSSCNVRLVMRSNRAGFSAEFCSV